MIFTFFEIPALKVPLIEILSDNEEYAGISLMYNAIHGEEDKKFDVVFLSNIPYYLTTDKIVGSINEQLLPIISDDGIISMYHQGMRINWFSQRLENKKFKLQRVVGNEYDKGSVHYQFNMFATGQVLDAHAELVSSGLDVSMEEIPSYGGATGSNVDVDIISNIRRR